MASRANITVNYSEALVLLGALSSHAEGAREYQLGPTERRLIRNLQEQVINAVEQTERHNS